MVADESMKVEKLVYGGAGLGRIGGRVHLVPFVLPGEIVRVAAEKQSKDVVQATVTGIIEASDCRVSPPCPYFTRCGGCDYQHMSYEDQLEQKRSILAETIRRVGRFEPPTDTSIIYGSPWAYRNRTRFHVERGRIGYLEKESHRLCAIEHCPISSPSINSRLAQLISQPRLLRDIREIELFTNEQELQETFIGAERITGAPLEYEAAGHIYRVSANSFFQVNRFLIDRLVEAAIDNSRGAQAIDVYAGVGLFSLALAHRFEWVTAVEGHASAARDLAFNVKRAGVAVQVTHRPAEIFLDSVEHRPDLILLDPPRAGFGPRVVRQLCRIAAPRLTIVSCDPATLARDLAGLLAGGYQIEKTTLVDLFPQTYHIETVTRLVLAGR